MNSLDVLNNLINGFTWTMLLVVSVVGIVFLFGEKISNLIPDMTIAYPRDNVSTRDGDVFVGIATPIGGATIVHMDNGDTVCIPQHNVMNVEVTYEELTIEEILIIEDARAELANKTKKRKEASASAKCELFAQNYSPVWA